MSTYNRQVADRKTKLMYPWMLWNQGTSIYITTALFSKGSDQFFYRPTLHFLRKYTMKTEFCDSMFWFQHQGITYLVIHEILSILLHQIPDWNSCSWHLMGAASQDKVTLLSAWNWSQKNTIKWRKIIQSQITSSAKLSMVILYTK